MHLLSEQQDLELTTRFIKEEMLAFRTAGNTEIYRDDLEYACWLRRRIELDQSLLNLLHRGEIHVEDLDPENMESTKLVLRENRDGSALQQGS